MVRFPRGLTAPRKVRVYARAARFLLQWWEPTLGKTVSLCVRGDLATAVVEARKIDERLVQMNYSGHVSCRLTPRELVDQFNLYTMQRANAGDIDAATPHRYESSLKHYLGFVEQPSMARAYPLAARADQKLALDFKGYLQQLQISPNGHSNTALRPMQDPGYVTDVVRTMYAWATDPKRGNLLPDGFHNPFTGSRRRSMGVALGQPDITGPMAADFLRACDDYQLSIFAPLVLYGLRASEPCMIFQEHVTDGRVWVGDIPKLCYQTKGGSEKQLRLAAELKRVWRADGGGKTGLVLLRRLVVEGKERPALAGKSLESLVEEFNRRCRQAGVQTAVGREEVRDRLIRDAGGLDYDAIQREFRRVSDGLAWPARATLKDFRHLFASVMEDTGVPQRYQKFFMGHSQGRDAITHYTHLMALEDKYSLILKGYAPVVEVLEQRTRPPQAPAAIAA